MVGDENYKFDIVISNILIQDLFKIADEKHFPKDYVKEIKSLSGTGSLCAYYSLKKVDPKLIGSHYMVNFMIVPIMLITLNPWAGILMFFPLLGFILNNLILHGTLFQPKTM